MNIRTLMEDNISGENVCAEHGLCIYVEVGKQTFVGEVPASFVYSDIDYNNTRRYRIKQSEVKCIRRLWCLLIL